MNNDVPKIHHHPAVAGKPLLFPFSVVFLAYIVDGGIGKGIKHTIAGASADDKVIGKGDDIFQVHQDDVFSLFIFQGVYDVAGKFECIQVSPHDFDNGAENNFV